ncbi:MAG: CRISPR-associated ring nuclease Csm6 [Flavobacteriaceae bacterium]
MTSEKKQVVLLSLVGTAPAVLTETVWALAHENEAIIPDRVIAMTTSSGAALIREKLFKEGHWKKLLEDLGSQVEIGDRLRFGPISDSIRVFPDLSHSRELDDIRTAEDNEAVAEFFMEVIRSFVENDSIRLIVSIAGGRKTTSALLYSVMSLLGRADDEIHHILVDDQWIYQPDFMYPGCQGVFVDQNSGKSISSKGAKLQLVHVPFVPLRYLFERDLQRSAGSFVSLMNQVRNRTINVTDDLTIQLSTKTGELIVSGESINLSANEFLIYLYFARRVLDGLPSLGGYALIGDDLQDLRDEHLEEDDFSHWTQRSLTGSFEASEDTRKWISSIRGKLRRAGFENFQIDRLVPRGGHLAIELPKESVTIEA